MNGVTYDTGALIAADHNDRRMWALHAGFLALETSPTVPTSVLAEAWRGGPRQANLARLSRRLKMRNNDALRAGLERAVDVGLVETRHPNHRGHAQRYRCEANLAHGFE